MTAAPLIIPVINEVFGEHYSGHEKIIFSPNGHFLNRQGGNEDERITDSSFQIQGKESKKYHLECQSSPDSSMLVRPLTKIQKQHRLSPESSKKYL